MAQGSKKKGTIGILTGGGDVPGLNPAIRAVTIRALREGYQVIGLRKGWSGITEIIRDKNADNSEHFDILTEQIVNKVGYDDLSSFTRLFKSQTGLSPSQYRKKFRR